MQSSFNIENLQQKLSDLYIQFSQIFGCADIDASLFKELRSLNVLTCQPCAKKLKYEGAWTCKDCEGDSTCIICMECYERSKEKHKNHKVLFKPKANGCCDCGDPDAWSVEGTCDDHLSSLNTQEDIDEYIKTVFHEEFLKQINDVLYKIFDTLCDYFINGVNYTKINSDLQLADIVGKFLEFIYKISDANLAMLHIVSGMLSTNYNNHSTNHRCVGLFSNNDIIIINKTEEKHQCQCQFIRLLFNVWNESIKREGLMFLLLKNFKLKLIMGVAFYSLYTELNEHKAETIQDLAVQISSTELSEVIFKNTEFISMFSDDLYKYIENKLALISEKKNDNNIRLDYSSLYYILKKFQRTIIYIIKPSTVKKASECTSLYKRMIDILCLIHNENSFKLVKEFQHDGWNEYLCEVENSILYAFSFLVSLIDFNANTNVNEILLYLVSKIANQNHTCLDETTFSFHLTLYRGFSLFLCRYIVSLAHFKKIDIYAAIQNIFKEIPTVTSLMSLLSKELIKYIMFISSLPLNKFVFYGEYMIVYMRMYYIADIFYGSDFALMQILYSQDETLFSLDKIENAIKVFDKEEGREEILLNLLTAIFTMIRSRDVIFNRFSTSFRDLLHNKVNDNITKEIVLNEADKFIDIAKRDIISNMLTHDNSVTFSEIGKYYQKYISVILPEDSIDKVIASITDKVTLLNGTVIFSIKDNVLTKFDIDLIMLAMDKAKAENYILSFKKKEVSLMNTYNIECISMMKECYTKLYENYYKSYSDIIEDFIKQGSSVKLNGIKDKLKEFYNFYMKNFLVLIDTINSNPENEFFKGKKETLLPIATKLLSSYKGDDDTNEKYIIHKLSEFTGVKSSAVLSHSNTMSKSNMLKAKYKNKFKTQNEKLKQKYTNVETTISSSITTEDVTNEEQCIICRGKVNPDNFTSSPYGLISYINIDAISYRSTALMKTKEYKKYNKDKAITYKKYKRSNPSSKNEKYHTHIVSCGHYVHFDCYLKMQTETLVKKNTVLMECPLCKAMTNLCVHDIMSCKEQNLIENIVCGYSLENILDDNFKIENVMSQSALKVVPQCQDFIERILAVKDKHEVLIKDLSAEKEFVYWYKKLSEDFGEQVDFMNSYKDSTINMTILTNFVIAMRVLLITGAIPHIDKVRNSMKEIINKLKEQKNNIDYVNNDYKAMINELFFSLCILISPSAFNNSIKTIIDLINPLISYNSAIKSEFVKTGNTNITISQAIDQSIFSSCFNIIQSKLSLINSIITLSNFSPMTPLPKLEPPSPILPSSSPSFILPSSTLLCDIPLKITFINLPNTLLDLITSYQKRKCLYCKKPTSSCYICLVCGKKMCSTIDCFTKGTKPKTAIIYHSIACCGGTCPYISTTNGELVIIHNKFMENDGVFLYKNKFGEPPKQLTISNEYVLVKEELERSLKKLIDLDFRKLMRINSNYLLIMENLEGEDFEVEDAFSDDEEI